MFTELSQRQEIRELMTGIRSFQLLYIIIMTVFISLKIMKQY